MLNVHHLCKSLGGRQIVRNLSFNVAHGEIVALIGPNGAGKTTTFNMLNGQLRADQGSITLEGESLQKLSPCAVYRRGVARTFQIAQTFESFSVIENVQIALLARDKRSFKWWQKAHQYAYEEATHWLAAVGLQHRAKDCANALAYGDIKRLELALALLSSPKLLLMDEPTAGMATDERHSLMMLVRQLTLEHQTSVLFTEHSMDMVFKYSDRVLVLANGELVLEGDPQSVRQHSLIRSIYLGQGLSNQKETSQ